MEVRKIQLLGLRPSHLQENPQYVSGQLWSRKVEPGAASSALRARQMCLNTIYGVVGNKQITERIVDPDGPPTKLPKISPTTEGGPK
jgi:hypothetical protein